MDSFSITTRYTLTDWRAYAQACARRADGQASVSRQLSRLVVFMLIGVAFAAFGQSMGAPFQIPSFVAGMGLLALSLVLNARKVQRTRVPDDDGQFLAPLTLEFELVGLQVVREGSHSFTSWSSIKGSTTTAEHVFIWVDRMNAHIVPVRDLPPQMSLAQLQAWLDKRIEQPAPPTFATSPTRESLRGLPRRLTSTGWCAALLRLLTLRRTDLPDRPSPALLAALAVKSLAVWAILDWLRNRPDAAFYVYGVPSIGWYALWMLMLAAVLTLRSVPRTRFAVVLTLVLAATPLAILLTWLIDVLVPANAQMVATLAALAYFVCYAVRSMVALTGNSQMPAITLALFVAVAFVPATNALYVEPSLWAVPEDTSADQAQVWPQAESLLFTQSARIDEAVAAVSRPPGELPAAFFLGFAGTGEQRVFSEEIRLAARVIGASYGSDDRSVLLLNDSRDVDSQPLASPTALRYALRGIASKMDLERDVLFLSISSHGSEDGTIAVSNGPLLLQDLSVTDLADALEESGIRWRVILVSACYSGAFVAPLQNPDTIVITASAADRTSFGCADDRDLTYFGEAFYRDALPGATSLRGAFETARDDIKRRELDEGITPSRPQAFFGASIEMQLQRLQQVPGRH